MRELIKKILKEETDDNLPQSHPFIKLIKKIIPNQFKHSFHDWEENYFQSVINFHITKVTMWNVEKYRNKSYHLRSIYQPAPNSKYEGTIYIKIDSIFVIDPQTDETNQVYYEDDLPDYVWEDFLNTISDKVSNWMEGVNLDIELIFK